MTRKTLHMCLVAALAGIAFGASAHGDGDKFKMMDTNGDGQISAAEHEAGVTKMFTEMDADKDGFVTAAEMDSMHASMKSADKGEKRGMDMKSSEKIAKMDKDGDGKLSAAEHSTGAQEMFGKMDADGNGMLSRAEMNAGHDKMMSKDKPAKDDWSKKPTGTQADASDHSEHSGHDDAAKASTPPADDNGG
ncbi:Calcium-binding EF-hand-containing protein [Lysobacter dokdonensis DS-58]|uniref:Calcium-binding EF-hand-containing protein n=1 Tax=Lysobacter dokdonensis DS-58 TaxID=1300345 RepID=A0A0A2WHC6_9GAMM|nr:EF-hand domain-containing protein [Lysobacter dokdonensis]KGQ18112.1 Calcium-binding EF-hand-containing protein [Lysobacter dokdonensis DS-58]